MALDGIVIANIVRDLNDLLLNGRIYKIAQPENDELLLTIKNNKEQYRLLMSASASLPLIYLTKENKQSPMTAPNFCMLLRKHLSNGRIVAISQPGLERIINFEIEHLNELGDLCRKTLIMEIMGKHSNIIFCNDEGMIIDSIKHISGQVSSVREVLPGRSYFIPETQQKEDPLTATPESFSEAVSSKPVPLAKAIYTSFTGISPAAAEEICFRASAESERPASALSQDEMLHLSHTFVRFMEDVRMGRFEPSIIFKGKEPVEFSSVHLFQYEGLETVKYENISEVLENYYSVKNAITRIRQKSADLRKIVQTALERNRKKYELQVKQMKDTEKRDKYRIYGELINAYGYSLPENAKSLEAVNYYDGETVTIPLDPDLTPIENAKKYFDKYNKLKRTYEALSKLVQETEEEIAHLESISTALDIALAEEDLVELKEELMDYGYIKRKYSAKKVKVTSRPLHYLSSDGYHIYVGKNNFQNDELTFKFASGNDWWFHAKGRPGSHVIVKSNGDDLPDRTFEEAGRLAAYYSSGRDAQKVEVDYTEKKNIKKPAGGKPGFVIYYTNYSLMIEPDIAGLQQI